MTLNGLNAIRDFHSALLTHIEAGTGTTQETAEDTDLETPSTGSEKAIDSSTTADQFFKKQGTVTSVDAITNDFTEVGWKLNSPEQMQSRITHVAISHTNEEDIIYETRWFVKGRFE